ncbi:PEP-CTERM sorting domain-containing protein [Altererythrobacter xixiisoli]|uniref:PEP-CTERM sorting domain-containing protein n=1 Tax=Croceibacterium xixiisoli TaxID=1476466 RepID=A0A6I4TT71_9SPHN|nr:PEP-CTERM sorting domain-containing protein [Croceibacterium xixiisoli]MXO98400.1 PEP-CTERM sorting domain-containing protein [Croceibacterium xixiisoli]
MIRNCLIALSLATAATVAVSGPAQAQVANTKPPLPVRVPEPGMLALFGAGLVSVALLRRSRKNRS